MLVLGKSRLLLPLLLFLLPNKTQGMDGCQGNIDLYGFNPLLNHWRCGDVCTHKDEDCICGNSTLRRGNSSWCCGTNCTGGNCLRWKSGHSEGDGPWNCAEWLPAICTTGVALNLNESCQGDCNYYNTDVDRSYGSRSYVPACVNASICVKEGDGTTNPIDFQTNPYRAIICTGNSSCEGELDWCREEGRKNETCPRGVPQANTIRCLRIGSKVEGGNGTKSIPGQCIAEFKTGDGEYNCLDRSDEDPFRKAANKETIINLAKLKNCTLEDGDPGLECGSQEKSICIETAAWCNWIGQECPVLGAGIRIDNPSLCKNSTFWRTQMCGKLEEKKHWIRCQGGNTGQCVHKAFDWGLEGGRTVTNCKDGSDLYRPISLPREAVESSRHPLQADYNEHGSTSGAPNNFAGEEKPTTAADKKDSAHGSQSERLPSPPPPQVWKTLPESERNYDQFYKGTEKGAKYRKDSLTELWMIPVSDPFKVPTLEVPEFEHGPWVNGKNEWANFYSSDEYVKDKTTNLMMAPTTEAACEANKGFVCKVRFSGLPIPETAIEIYSYKQIWHE